MYTSPSNGQYDPSGQYNAPPQDQYGPPPQGQYGQSQDHYFPPREQCLLVSVVHEFVNLTNLNSAISAYSEPQSRLVNHTLGSGVWSFSKVEHAWLESFQNRAMCSIDMKSLLLKQQRSSTRYAVTDIHIHHRRTTLLSPTTLTTT